MCPTPGLRCGAILRDYQPGASGLPEGTRTPCPNLVQISASGIAGHAAGPR
jgi:hypothetical protein